MRIKIIIVALVVMTSMYLLLSFSQENKKQIVQQEKVDTISNTIEGIAEKYNANRYISRENETTLFLQQQLINGRPTEFVGEINDISTRDEKYYINATPRSRDDENKTLELECSKDIADNTDKNLTSHQNRFVIVANIVEVIYSPGDSAEATEPSFVLRGTCVDVIPY